MLFVYRRLWESCWACRYPCQVPHLGIRTSDVKLASIELAVVHALANAKVCDLLEDVCSLLMLKLSSLSLSLSLCISLSAISRSRSFVHSHFHLFSTFIFSPFHTLLRRRTHGYRALSRPHVCSCQGARSADPDMCSLLMLKGFKLSVSLALTLSLSPLSVALSFTLTFSLFPLRAKTCVRILFSLSCCHFWCCTPPAAVSSDHFTVSPLFVTHIPFKSTQTCFFVSLFVSHFLSFSNILALSDTQAILCFVASSKSAFCSLHQRYALIVSLFPSSSVAKNDCLCDQTPILYTIRAGVR